MKASVTQNNHWVWDGQKMENHVLRSPVGKRAGHTSYTTDALGDTTEPTEPGQSHKLRKDKG